VFCVLVIETSGLIVCHKNRPSKLWDGNSHRLPQLLLHAF